jgi:hypothetical protein
MSTIHIIHPSTPKDAVLPIPSESCFVVNVHKLPEYSMDILDLESSERHVKVSLWFEDDKVLSLTQVFQDDEEETTTRCVLHMSKEHMMKHFKDVGMLACLFDVSLY